MIKKIANKFLIVILIIVVSLSFVACKSVEDDFIIIKPGKLPEKNMETDYSPLKKYDKVVNIKVLGTAYDIIGEVPPTYNGRPSGPANNAFNDAALKHLNIKLQYVSTVTGENYEQRLSTMIANNDVPDIFVTSNATTFDILRKTKLIADIAPTYYYLNDDFQNMYEQNYYSPAFESCMEDGKLYAFPNVSNPYEIAQKLYLRKDWLDIVGKSIPTTYEELIEVARAFKTNNSKIAAATSGLSANDIIPIGITKELSTTGNNTAQGFFNIFGAQPDAFLEKDGKLYSSNTSSEMKTALVELNKLYKEGLLAQEFYNHTHTKVTNDIVAGKVGIISGMWHAASSPLQDSVSNEYTPSAEWVSIELPSRNGEKSLPIVEKTMIQNYIMVKRGFAYPDALAKLTNLFFDMFYSDNAFETYGTLSTPKGGFFYSWVPAKLWYSPYSMEMYERSWDVFNRLFDKGFRISDAKYTQMLNKEFNWSEYYNEIAEDEVYGAIFNELKIRERENAFKYGYPYMQAIKTGKKPVQMNMIEKRGYGIYEQNISNTGGYAYVTELSKGIKQSRFSEFYGVRTPSQQNHGEYLQTFSKGFYMQVISGSKSIDGWNTFVNNYNKNGGNSVASQVNQWFQS